MTNVKGKKKKRGKKKNQNHKRHGGESKKKRRKNAETDGKQKNKAARSAIDEVTEAKPEAEKVVKPTNSKFFVQRVKYIKSQLVLHLIPPINFH